MGNMSNSVDRKRDGTMAGANREEIRHSSSVQTLNATRDPHGPEPTESQRYRSRSPTLSGFPAEPGSRNDSGPPSSAKLASAPTALATPAKRPSNRPRNYHSLEMVGVRAMDLGRETRRTLAPRVVATDEFILGSPIDGLEFFLIGFVDGKRVEADLCDLTGWSRDDVTRVLERLVRLGIVAID